MWLRIAGIACFLFCTRQGLAEDEKKVEPPAAASQIDWSPTIPIPLATRGLCIFTDQGLIYIIHDLTNTTTPAFDLTSFWSSHTTIPHEQAVIHVLKPAMPFSLKVTPYLDLKMEPVLTGDPIIKHLQPISLQRNDNALVFNGVKLHKVVEFVHEGRRFQAVLTTQMDDGFARQMDVRPYYRVLPSIQGLAVQIDADAAQTKTSGNSFTLSTPMPGYRSTQHTFWSQVHRYGQKDQLKPTSEPAISFCQAMQAMHEGDGARVVGILQYLKELYPLIEYHPLTHTLLAWAEYMLGRTCQMPHLLTLDDAPNWPGFYGSHPFCHAGFWEGIRWNTLPDPIFRRIWEEATREAHYHQCLPSLRTLLNPSEAERGIPLHREFYKVVVARFDEPHMYAEMLKNFLHMEVLAPACPPDISAWARYQSTKDTTSIWSPFVPLWQMHQDLEKAFKAKKYREVLTAIAMTPFNPVLSDVFQKVLEEKNLSHIEKLGLYERFKNLLPTTTCNQIVMNIVKMWCELDLVPQANTLLVSNQSVLSEDVRNRLWLTLAESYASKKSWTDVEYALRQISGQIPDDILVATQLQQANLMWYTGHQDDACKIWNGSTNISLIEQGARLLMESERYKEAADRWALLLNLKGKEAVRPYAICLWQIKDMDRLELLQKTNAEDAWLQWIVEATKSGSPQLENALNLAEVTLKQAAELQKA